MRAIRAWTIVARITPRSIRARGVNSIRAGKATHREFDAIAGKHPPGLDLGHVGGLGKAGEQFARLGAGGLARQREGLAREGAAGERAGGTAGDVGGAADCTHDTVLTTTRPLKRNVMPRAAQI